MKIATDVSFSRPLTYSRDYPSPAFKIHPTCRYPVADSQRQPPAGVDATFHAARARYGLAFIALSRLKPGDLILLPAYHCPAMVEPFLWAGCRVGFYPVTKALAPVVSALEEPLKAARAIVLTRYFGFEQASKQLIALARERDCLVIEDLAHAAFISRLHGDVGVTSLTKFFPQPYGAEIWSSNPRLSEQLEQAIASRRLRQLHWALSHLHRKVKRKLIKKLGGGSGKAPYRYFDENDLTRPTALCTLQADEAPPLHASSSAGHRAHYQSLLEISSRSTIGVPLYPVLPGDVTPYMFPFLLHSTDSFHAIRNAGIPLYRWEELAPTNCEVSSSYRSRLIQIPCHQDMKAEDFALIDECLTGARV